MLLTLRAAGSLRGKHFRSNFLPIFPHRADTHTFNAIIYIRDISLPHFHQEIPPFQMLTHHFDISRPFPKTDRRQALETGAPVGKTRVHIIAVSFQCP